MAQTNKTCQSCGELGHSKFYCKTRPKKPIARTAIKKKPFRASTRNGLKSAKKKSKKTDRQKAKEKAWEAFSVFIRTRDCIRFTGDPTQGKCVTCKALKPFKELQAGHFVGGRGNAVLFNEQIVYSQCGYCNQKPPMGLGGNYAAYTLWMMDEGYDREQIEELLNLRHQTKVYKIHDFIELKELYEEKTKRLKEAL